MYVLLPPLIYSHARLHPSVLNAEYFRGGGRKFCLGGGHTCSSNICACAKNFGHAPLIEGQGSRVLLVVQNDENDENDEKWMANMHRDRFLSIY